MRLIDFLRDYREAVEEAKRQAEQRTRQQPPVKRFKAKRYR